MNWLTLMTLRDGTTIEMPVPAARDTAQDGVHGYRVRGSDGVTEFATLPEVIHHLLTPGSSHLDEVLTVCAAAHPAGEGVPALHAGTSGRRAHGAAGQSPSTRRRAPGHD